MILQIKCVFFSSSEENETFGHEWLFPVETGGAEYEQ